MKIWIPTNPIWYLVVIIFFSPFLFPVWQVKLLSLTSLLVGLPVLLLFFASSSKLSQYIKETPLVKKWRKNKVVLGIRIFFLICGLLLSLNAVPLIKDIFSLISSGATHQKVETISKKDNGVAPGGFFYSTINFANSNINENYYAWFFPLRYLEVGRTYEFTYLENSRFVLEATIQ